MFAQSGLGLYFTETFTNLSQLTKYFHDEVQYFESIQPHTGIMQITSALLLLSTQLHNSTIAQENLMDE